MANNHINELIATDELFQLIQKENFVGWVFSLDYDNALVVTNDAWKYAVKGIPHNAFLLASTFTPDNYADVDEMDREVILLRVMGTCKLPQDDDAIKTKLDSYQNLTELYPTQGREDFDAITKNKLQFGGLTCRVLGTFYMKNSELHLGSDIETFSVSMRMGVYSLIIPAPPEHFSRCAPAADPTAGHACRGPPHSARPKSVLQSRSAAPGTWPSPRRGSSGKRTCPQRLSSWQ